MRSWPPTRQTIAQKHADDVATYVAAGGEETVQRVITAVYGVTKKLDQWYARQFVDHDLSPGGVVGAGRSRARPVTPA